MSAMRSSDVGEALLHTNYQTQHLVLLQNINSQSLYNLIVVLIRSSTRSHDTKLSRPGAIQSLLLQLQLLHKLHTVINTMRLKVDKVQSSSELFRIGFAGEVHQLGQGPTYLPTDRESATCAHI